MGAPDGTVKPLERYQWSLPVSDDPHVCGSVCARDVIGRPLVRGTTRRSYPFAVSVVSRCRTVCPVQLAQALGMNLMTVCAKILQYMLCIVFLIRRETWGDVCVSASIIFELVLKDQWVVDCCFARRIATVSWW